MERRSHGWKAGGNDTSGHLDRCPAYGSGKCVSWILRIVGEEDSEAIDRGKNNAVIRISILIVDEYRENLQETKTECHCECELLYLSQLQPPDLGNGKNQSGEIAGNS